MSDDNLNNIRREVGDLRENMGELRGEMRSHKELLLSIAAKIEENRRSNKDVHSRLEAKVNAIQTKMVAEREVSESKRRMVEWIRSLATSSVVVAVFGYVFNWFQRH